MGWSARCAALQRYRATVRQTTLLGTRHWLGHDHLPVRKHSKHAPSAPTASELGLRLFAGRFFRELVVCLCCLPCYYRGPIRAPCAKPPSGPKLHLLVRNVVGMETRHAIKETSDPAVIACKPPDLLTQDFVRQQVSVQQQTYT